MSKLTHLIKFHKGRLSLIDSVARLPDNWQHFKTPISITDEMIETTDLHNKNILVLFNMEFVEQLIHKYNVPNEQIFLLADTETESLIAKKVYNIQSVSLTLTEFNQKYSKKENHPIIQKVTEMAKKFDVVFSNPPYNANIDLKILREVNKIADEMVIVHPSTWLIDLKGKSKLYNDFKNEISLKSVSFFDGAQAFSIRMEVPCIITHYDKKHKGDIEVQHFDEKISVSSIKDITKFGSSWETIVNPFMKKISNYISNNSSIWEHKVNALNKNVTMPYYVQLSDIRGAQNIFANSFYALVGVDIEKHKGIRKSTITNTYSFTTENEVTNFLKYCKTDFARFCLSIYKNSSTMHRGELEIVPYMDFTQEWTDEKLFKYFNIDQETQEYIRNFLPDFHNIRK